MFCTQCGFQAKTTEKFCTQCGASLTPGPNVSSKGMGNVIDWANPFLCQTPVGRKVGIGIFSIAVIFWFVFIAIESEGFSEIKPAGWLITFGLPVTVYLLVLFGMRLFYRAPISKTVRYVVSANIIWIFLVSTWGFIWGWDSTFQDDEYFALFVLPILGSWISVFLWRWSTKD